MILTKKFFERSAMEVARDLLGKFLVRQWRGKEIAFMITETEAYEGPKDKASHAFRDVTERNKPMFGPPGHWYIYFTYGMHWMLNIVTGKTGYPSAVLIRGLEGYDGPAKLTKALHIDKRFNAQPAVLKTGLWLEDREVRLKKSQIKRGPRIGVAYAGPIWSKKHYRFWLSN